MLVGISAKEDLSAIGQTVELFGPIARFDRPSQQSNNLFVYFVSPESAAHILSYSHIVCVFP